MVLSIAVGSLGLSNYIIFEMRKDPLHDVIMRKVRAAQGGVPPNGWLLRGRESATENNRHSIW